MSLPLRPINIDSSSLIVDVKQKRFEQNVSSALNGFDDVTEWADYISNLGKLLKALQSWSPQFQTVKYYVPYPYQVSRRLASSLLPNLPAGVHSKAIEVYTFIFEKIGLEVLASECNIWVPGIVPLMSYAAMSVKSQLIELYETYLIQLDSKSLKILIKPLLTSLLPGIDDESSEYQSYVMKLIETLLERLEDASLFWQTFYLITISSEEHRLGAAVWFTKKFPSLNGVPHLMAKRLKNETDNDFDIKALDPETRTARSKSVLLAGSDVVLFPEPGLLIRSLISCLEDDNDVIIKRAILDVLLQRIRLDSPVFENIITSQDKSCLLYHCSKVCLSKDMSLNRRVWNWLMGPTTNLNSTNAIKTKETNFVTDSTAIECDTSNYFQVHGLESLTSYLANSLKSEKEVVTVFKICTSLIDKWDVGSAVVSKLLLGLLISAEKFQNNQLILTEATTFFNCLNPSLFWKNFHIHLNESKNLSLLNFTLSTFNISENSEESSFHLPLILLTVINLKQIYWTTPNTAVTLVNVVRLLLPKISNLSNFTELKTIDDAVVIKSISNYYTAYTQMETESIPKGIDLFSEEDITNIIVTKVFDLTIKLIADEKAVSFISELFIMVFNKIDTDSLLLEKQDKSLNDIMLTSLNSDALEFESVTHFANLFNSYLVKRLSLLNSITVLKLLIKHIWIFLQDSKTRDAAVNLLQVLNSSIDSKYIEKQLAHAFLEEKDDRNKVFVFDFLWSKLDDNTLLLNKTLDLLLDELFDKQSSAYLFISKWILTLSKRQRITRLFDFLIARLMQLGFLNRNHLYKMDDLDQLTYRIQVIDNVLNTNDRKLYKDFCQEKMRIHVSDEVSETKTYKQFVTETILNYLQMDSNNHVSSIRICLQLLENMLNGTEENFKEIAIELLEMSSKYISKGGYEYESIAVSLVNIVTKVLQLSQVNGIALDIFDDNTTHLKYLNNLVTSITNMEGTLLVLAYMELLSESTSYFEASIFKMVVPLTASMIECINKLMHHQRKENQTESIAILLDSLKKLLVETYDNLSVIEDKSGLASADFLQSVVTNVFMGDTTNASAKTQGERDVLSQSIRRVVSCCTDLWAVKNVDQYLREKVFTLTNTLFELEPSNVLENIIYSKGNSSVHSLVAKLSEDNPNVILPCLLDSITKRCNKNASVQFSVNVGKLENSESGKSNKLQPKIIAEFLLNYLESHCFADEEVEGCGQDFTAFLKNVIPYSSSYNGIWSAILRITILYQFKVKNPKLKKELCELFIKYLPSAMSNVQEKYDASCYNDLKIIATQLVEFTNEDEKFLNSIRTTITSTAIEPKFKYTQFDEIPEKVKLLALEIARISQTSNAWRQFVKTMFSNNDFFFSMGNDTYMEEIIALWAQYPGNGTILIDDLLLSLNSPSLISFPSWDGNADVVKSVSLLRICYLLLILPKDTFMNNFQMVMTFVTQVLLNNNDKLKAVCWKLLRVIVIKISVVHLTEYWPLVTYCLQINLQQFLEKMSQDIEIDGDCFLQLCKTLDVLLLCNFDSFNALNSWLFVIDTVNCISHTNSFVSLIDKFTELKQFQNQGIQINTTHPQKPLLLNVHAVKSAQDLSSLFHKWSHLHYESLYSLQKPDTLAIQYDMLLDIFTPLP